MSAVNGPLSDLPVDKDIHTSIPGRSYIDTASVESVERFRDTLQLAEKNSAQNVAEAPPVQQTSESEVVRTYGQIDTESLALENERALRGENVIDAVRNRGENGTVVDVSRNQEGDLILDGISTLRGMFDDQKAAATNISSSALSTTELITTQVEIMKFSLLMDVTSKLTGKSTQTFDTLMKGQ